MVDIAQELGTKFTGDITDVSGKVKEFLNLLRELKRANQSASRSVSGHWRTASVEMDRAVSSARATATAIQKYASNVRSATNDLDKHTQKTNAYGKSLKNIRTFTDQLRNAFRISTAYGLAATAIYSVVNAARAGVDEIIEFDQALKNLQAITQATDSQLSVMGDKILEVAERTKFSSTEIANGMVLLGQAGLSAEESTNAIGAAADLATGTLSSMELVTDLLTTTLRSYNLDAIESSRVADVFANAINKSKLNVDKLRIAFNYIAATAHQTGLSLEQTAAATMTLADHGLRASTIGTGLRQVLSRLLSPNRKLREAFEEYGIELDKVSPKTVGFEQAIMNLVPAIWDYQKSTVDMAKAFEIFGLRGAQAAAVIVKAFVSGDYNRAMKRALEVGSAEEMAAKQAEGLGVMWKNLADRAKVLAIALGDLGITGAMRAFIMVTRDVVSLMTAVAKDTKTLFDSLFNSSKKAIDQYGKQIVKNNQLAASLQAYKGAMTSILSTIQNGLPVEEQHIAIIKRLILDHPELAKNIDSTRISYETLKSAIDEVNRTLEQNENKTSIARGLRIKEYEKQLNRQKEVLDNVNNAFKSGIGKSGWDTVIKVIQEKINAVTSSLKDEREQWVSVITDMVSGSDTPDLAAETYIDTMESLGDISSETADILKKKVLAALKDLETGFKPKIMEKVLRGWRLEFEELYKTLDPSQKFDFRVKFKTLQSQIASVKKQYGDNLSDDQLHEMNIVISDKEDQWLNDFKASLEKKNQTSIDAKNREVNALLQSEKQYQGLLAGLQQNEIDKVNEQYQAKATAIEDWYNKASSLHSAGSAELVDIGEKYQRLIAENEKAKEKKLLDISRDTALDRLEIKKRELEAEAEIERRAAVGKGSSVDDINRKQAESKIELLKEIADLERSYMDETIRLYGEGSKEAVASEKRYLDSVIDLKRAETDIEEKAANQRIQLKTKELKSRLKLERKYSQEWFKIAQELRDIGAWTDMGDLEEARLRNSEDMFDGVRLAMKQYEKDHKTLTERISDAWNGSFSSMGDSFHSFMNDSVKGEIKSVGDYVSDFLLNIANQVNNVLSQLITNGIMQGIGGLFNTSGLSSSQVNLQTGSPATVKPLASGGWLREQIVGRGLQTGRLYTLGEKEDELVTPKSKLGGGDVYVEVYNNSSEKASVEKTRTDTGERLLKIFIGSAAKNIVDGGELGRAMENTYGITRKGW